MSDRPALPAWFFDALDHALAQLGWRFVRWEDQAAVLVDASGTESPYGLENVFRSAARLPKAERVVRIVEHFRQLKSVNMPNSLAANRERLYPRLRLPVEDEQVAEDMWSVPFQDTGLICVLVIDSPQAVTYVTKNLVEESGRSGEEWFRVALGNLRLTTSADQIVEVNDAGLLCVGTADSYDAARGLLLEEFAPADPRGFIASVPNRDRLYFYPVGKDPLGKRFAPLLIETLRDHQQGAYAICDSIFWVHKGLWCRIEWTYEEGELRVTFPAPLKALLVTKKGRKSR